MCPTSTESLRARILLALHVRSPLHRPRVQEALPTGQLLAMRHVLVYLKSCPASVATCRARAMPELTKLSQAQVISCYTSRMRLEALVALAARAGRECTVILPTGCHVRHAARMPTARWGQTKIEARASATPDSMAMQPRPAAGVTSVLPTRPQLLAPGTIHLSQIAIAMRDTTATQEP